MRKYVKKVLDNRQWLSYNTRDSKNSRNMALDIVNKRTKQALLDCFVSCGKPFFSGYRLNIGTFFVLL